MPDSEQYKLTLGNKFKYLDVLCFPTLFPSGRFGESHPRKVPISASEFAKSHLLNKDGRFCKDDQYVFYLLWQKEMREIAAGVYNVLKSTQQQAMPVGEFMDRLSSKDRKPISPLRFRVCVAQNNTGFDATVRLSVCFESTGLPPSFLLSAVPSMTASTYPPTSERSMM